MSSGGYVIDYREWDGVRTNPEDVRLETARGQLEAAANHHVASAWPPQITAVDEHCWSTDVKRKLRQRFINRRCDNST